MMLSALAFFLVGCESELKREAALEVGVIQNDNVKLEDETIVVRKGQPVVFNLAGDPDNITFFSGETGQQYIYRDRDQVDPEEIESSTLSFSVWFQYGTAKASANVLKMYISDAFPGLSKNNFAADSALVRDYQWNDLVDQSLLPQKPGSASAAIKFDVDLKTYLGKRFAIAINYEGHDNSAAQPRVNFEGMRIDNVMKDGTTSTLYAGNFGFTPINMQCHLNLKDQTGMKTNREYGTVTNNVSGIWNMVKAGTGTFDIHSSGVGAPLKYSWLVSDLIMANASSPDMGTPIKNITQRLDTYTYIYNKVGTYTATFVATNSNHQQQTRVVREVKVKVIE